MTIIPFLKLRKSRSCRDCYFKLDGIMGANRIFGAKTSKIPMVDIDVEDYGMLYRMAEKGAQPKIKIDAQSKILPEAKSFNTIGMIKGRKNRMNM
jgi:hypothetical protein